VQNGYVIAEQFFDAAGEMRAAFDSHFQNPQAHGGQHQVWNYWYVPDHYTYLKTSPLKVLPQALLSQFMQRLNSWAIASFGLTTNIEPWLSLYVDGCGQTIHNDAANGQMGYVYSLTKWEERNFLGGETLLFRPGNYWETDRITRSGAGTAFYEKVPSRFNQLLVFDDRIIHGVQTLQGTMDPLRGRVVIHGHLRAEAVAISGPLEPTTIVSVFGSASEKVKLLARQNASFMNGFVTLRLSIQPDGRVAKVQALCDRILSLSPDTGRIDSFRRDLDGILSNLLFPAAPAPSELTFPVLVSG
jgi:Rps23 Pro-64 3,4-dihydroxylase Tpa1-like proline 4-hydroxylase